LSVSKKVFFVFDLTSWCVHIYECTSYVEDGFSLMKYSQNFPILYNKKNVKFKLTFWNCWRFS